jgi:hypothetical protein
MKFPKQVFGFTSAKLRYLPVKQDEAFMSNEHASMPINPRKSLRKEHLKASWKVLLILCLLSTNSITFFYLLHSRGEETPPEYGRRPYVFFQPFVSLIIRAARVQDIKTTWTRFWWWTEYSGKNETATDELWDSILPSHGFVAMDRQWAADRHWPESLMLPSDPSKAVYLLEAYHQIHCLVFSSLRLWKHRSHSNALLENDSQDVLGSGEREKLHLQAFPTPRALLRHSATDYHLPC